MNGFREITPEQLEGNVFEKLAKDWMLVGACSDERVNMMTASWGGFGVLWALPVAYVFIRPQRYTREFVEKSKTLSLSFFAPEYRDALNLCGSKSGRDIDKVAACGFDTEIISGAPVFSQSHTAIICEKLYCQRFSPSCVISEDAVAKHYPNNDHHYMYIASIQKVLIK